MAEKPEGITGVGTPSDPYMVHSYDEIKWCCEDTDALVVVGDPVYLKLANDINCQDYDLSFTWSIVNVNNVDFDLNNKTIKTFYIAENSYLFDCYTNRVPFHIHDGKILNVYGHWFTPSKSLFYFGCTKTTDYCRIERISFSINISNFTMALITNIGSTNAPASHYTINECSFWLEGSMYALISSQHLVISGGCQILTCDFYYNNIIPASTATLSAKYLFNASDTYKMYMLDCRHFGSIDMGNSYIGHGFNYVTCRNCVFDLATITTSAYSSTVQFLSSPGADKQNYGIFNTEKLWSQYTMPTQYISCTTADMDMRVNPNADTVLQEKGFDVIKG